MYHLLYVLCLAAIFPISAHATSTASIINTNCSGSYIISLVDGASFSCAGNLTLDGGFITSDSLINISADGDLFVDNLTFTAPNVTFLVLNGMLTMGRAAVINTSIATFQSNPNTVSNWEKLNIGNSAIINLNQEQPSKITLDRVFGTNQTLSGALTLSSGGSISLGNTNGLMLPPNNTLSTPGGSIVIGSGGLITTGGGPYNPPIAVSAVPEPSTYFMVLLGLGLIMYRRKYKH